MTGDDVRDIFIRIGRDEDKNCVAPTAESIRNAMNFADIVLARDPKRNMRIRKLNSGGISVILKSERRWVHVEFHNDYGTTAMMIGGGKIKAMGVEDDRQSYEALFLDAQQTLDAQPTLFEAGSPEH